jgi:peptidyl-prolyl cis-trans isomerase C
MLKLLLTPVVVGACLVAAAQVPEEGVTMYVNDEPIYDWELKLLLPQVEVDMASQGLEPRGPSVLETLVNRAIDGKLLAQEARRRDIEPREDRIGDKMSKLIEQAGGRAELEAKLIQSAVTFDELRFTVVQADLVQSLVELERGGAGREVTDAEVRAYYDEHPELFTAPDKIRTRHIMIRVDSDATDAKRAEAEHRIDAIRTRALAGEDFAELAEELSEGPNASRGGDLGFTGRGDMVAGFDEVVWSLEVGEISEVIVSDLGYHLARVEEIREGSRLPLDEARPLIEELINQRRNADVIGSLVAELRQSADIRQPTD